MACHNLKSATEITQKPQAQRNYRGWHDSTVANAAIEAQNLASHRLFDKYNIKYFSSIEFQLFKRFGERNLAVSLFMENLGPKQWTKAGHIMTCRVLRRMCPFTISRALFIEKYFILFTLYPKRISVFK